MADRNVNDDAYAGYARDCSESSIAQGSIAEVATKSSKLELQREVAEWSCNAR